MADEAKDHPKILRSFAEQMVGDHPYWSECLTEAADLIERLTTKPMTLKECRDILNANEYSFCFAWEIQGPWRVEEPYVVASSNDDVDFGDECTIRLDLFEATCLARGFIAKKEASHA